jgi:DNA repair photolyase
VTRFISARKILRGSASKADPWFGTSYTINLYRGCSHGCIYCDSRSKCYQIDDFDNIQIKQNAIDLLHQELRSKKARGTIGFGSMNDCYMPLEATHQLSRRALEIVRLHRFPVHIITKGTLVTRDIDLLQDISKIYAAVSITITTTSDQLGQKIEPNAPLVSQRFAALQQLAEAGIYCGITLMPVIPFITDTEENIRQIVTKARQAGAKYIIGGFGMTLREGNREYFYKQLDRRFPGLKERFIQTFGDQYNCYTNRFKQLHNYFNSICRENDIATKMRFYKARIEKQGSLF